MFCLNTVKTEHFNIYESAPLYVLHCNPDFSSFFKKMRDVKMMLWIELILKRLFKSQFSKLYKRSPPEKSFVPLWSLSERLATLQATKKLPLYSHACL